MGRGDRRITIGADGVLSAGSLSGWGAAEPAGFWHAARLRPTQLWRYRLWVEGHAGTLLRRRSALQPGSVEPDNVHLKAAAEWLAAAQDASGNGGIVGRYRLDRGWTSSYPETTGYIVPTFLALAERHNAAYLERARRCVEFLLTTQLESGAFPANEIAKNRTLPSAFNTGQILHGLSSWYQHQRDASVGVAARRAGEWLVSVQDEDGAWRNFTYNRIPTVYTAHLSCWLADFGAYLDDERMLRSASRHLDWVLAQRRNDNGWIDLCGFTNEEQARRIGDLHTISYTLSGMLRTGLILRRADAVEAVMVAARTVANTLERHGWLPGLFDWQWRPCADSACLTGNAQMALIWLGLRDHTRDDAWLAPAYRALDLVKRAQVLRSSNPGLRGAVPGSDPVWGRYQEGVMPSWSAKFFIDALLHKNAIEAGP
jgi:hypothetical protein